MTESDLFNATARLDVERAVDRPPSGRPTPEEFSTFRITDGVDADFASDDYALTFRTWHDGRVTLAAAHGTHFGFVASGAARLTTDAATFPLATGTYFSIPETATLEGGQGFVVTQHDVRGFFHVGGPIEERGRLRYIDGCSDSVLVPPIVRGDPCLNLLHIPPGTSQTDHTHPSHRLGIVVSGRGICRTPSGDTPLAPGLAWVIPPDAVHSFHTTDESLRIVAFHPDSDCGPSDASHPMLNRTMVEGTSAAELRAGESPG